MAEAQASGSSSVSAFVTTLIVNGILCLLFIALFVIVRNREKRVYQARTVVHTVPPTQRPDPAPKGAFGWLNHLLNKSDSWLIQQAGPDGYFFLRYLFFFSAIFFLGGLIALPVLIPVNVTNGHNSENSGFDLISYSNVKNKNRVYAHVFVSWFFFGIIIYGIYRELLYYVSFRHAFQTTPYIDSLISTRTLLVTSLPKDLVDDESQVKSLFPAATSITFARDYKDLSKDVKERTKLAGKYEAALNKVVNKSVGLYQKLSKKNKPLPEPANQLASYIPEKKQPHHKLKPIIGQKVNTIDYTNEELPKLNEKIKTQQADYLHANAVGSVFLEFPSQLELQRALQAIRYHKPFRRAGSKAITNTPPDEIVWDNLSNSNVTRLGKKTIAVTILTLMIIFWAIPVAVVGCISNINFLTDKVPFLRFINNMPSVLMGIITGLLPTVALAILMSLVPPFIKFMGKVSGLITLQQIDLWCHDWYYAFQVIHSFLVMTLASSASSTATKIVSNPSSAMTLLGQNLPKASNFFICYILLQGLTIPGGALFQVVALILSKILGRVLDTTPRQKWSRFNSLSQPSWGVIYPVYSLIAVITICYAIIAPIIVAFAVVGLSLIYVAYLYNLTFVMGQTMDSRGRNYPKALFQTFVALYLAELCLIALFVMNKAWGPMGLEIAFLVFTIAAHLWLKWRFIPLYEQVPVSGIYDAAGNENYTYPVKDQGRKEIKSTGQAYWDNSSFAGGSIDEKATTEGTEGTVNSNNDNRDAKTKTSDDSSRIGDDEEAAVGTSNAINNNNNNNNSNSKSGVARPTQVGTASDVPANRTPSAGALKRFFQPTVHLSFHEVRKHLPIFLNEPVVYTDAQYQEHQYLHPAVKDAEPTFWIPKDKLGLSRELIGKSKGLLVSDENTDFDEKGKVTFTGPPPDYEEAIKV